jgi:HSP20 family protein
MIEWSATQSANLTNRDRHAGCLFLPALAGRRCPGRSAGDHNTGAIASLEVDDMLPMLRSRLASPSLFESSLEPWSDLRREIDRLFDSVLWNPGSNGPTGLQSWMPPMDIHDEDDLLRFSFEIPGVNPDDVNVTVENGVLTVSGEKKFEKKTGDEKKGPYSVERRYGRFERSIALPQSVDTDKVTAQYENGVLTLELPKSAESRKRKIEIGRGTSGDTQKKIESGEKGGRRVA